VALLGLAGVLLLGGCRIDMHVDPKLEPLVQTDFFPNGMASRPLVEGTVARGQLRADTYFYTGMTGGQPGNEMPSRRPAKFWSGDTSVSIFIVRPATP